MLLARSLLFVYFILCAPDGCTCPYATTLKTSLSPSAGTYACPFTVTLTKAPNVNPVSFSYSTSGSDPGPSGGTKADPYPSDDLQLTVDHSVKLVAYSHMLGYWWDWRKKADEPVDNATGPSSANYRCEAPPPPTIAPPSGSFPACPIPIAFGDKWPSAMIFFTADGSAPTSASASIKSGTVVPIVPMTKTFVVRAYAFASGEKSGEVHATYTCTILPTTPPIPKPNQT